MGAEHIVYLFTYSQPQSQVLDEEITEDDLRLIEERETAIRQLEVSVAATIKPNMIFLPFSTKALMLLNSSFVWQFIFF